MPNDPHAPFTQANGYPLREYTAVWDGKGTTNIVQKCGMPKGAMLYDPALETTVIVCRFRSAWKNQQVANDLLDLVAMEPRWTGDKGDNARELTDAPTKTQINKDTQNG